LARRSFRTPRSTWRCNNRFTLSLRDVEDLLAQRGIT
jgi:transposase-like protein